MSDWTQVNSTLVEIRWRTLGQTGWPAPVPCNRHHKLAGHTRFSWLLIGWIFNLIGVQKTERESKSNEKARLADDRQRIAWCQARIQGRWNGWIFTPPPPFFLSPLLSFFSFPSNIEITFDFSNFYYIITKIHPPPPFQNPGSAPGCPSFTQWHF